LRASAMALVVILLAAFAYAQKPESQQPNEVAHGSEKRAPKRRILGKTWADHMRVRSFWVCHRGSGNWRT